MSDPLVRSYAATEPPAVTPIEKGVRRQASAAVARGDDARHVGWQKMSKKALLVACAAVAVAGVFAIVLEPVSTRYHRSRMVAEFKVIAEIGPKGDQHRHIVAFARHRDALVRLGYFQHKRVPLRSVSVKSARGRALFEHLNRHLEFKDGYFEMPGYEPDTPDEVVIWATPRKMLELEKIVRQHEEGKASRAPSGSGQGDALRRRGPRDRMGLND